MKRLVSLSIISGGFGSERSALLYGGSTVRAAFHRAWVWEGSPDPDDLFLIELPMPRLEPGDVLVRNVMIGLNAVDWRSLAGDLGRWRLGQIPGVDGSGIVVDVGDDVSRDWIGKRVAYHQSLIRTGSFAEHTAVSSHLLMQVPSTVSWADAASMPCPALTAWLALKRLPIGSKNVLVRDADGATARHLVQFAAKEGIAVTMLRYPSEAEGLVWPGDIAPIDLSSFASGKTATCFDAVIEVAGDQRLEWPGPDAGTGGETIRVADWPDVSPFGPEIWPRLMRAAQTVLEALGERRWGRAFVREVPFELLGERLSGISEGAYPGRSVVRVTIPPNRTYNA